MGWIGLAGNAAAALEGMVVNVSTAGWFSPTQGGTNQATGRLDLHDPRQDDPDQSAIRWIFELAKTKLENDALHFDHTCSTWFNSGLDPNSVAPTAAAYIALAVLPNRFAHAEFKEGGSIVAGERTGAFVYGNNADGSAIAGTELFPSAAVFFNRNGAFFQRLYSLAHSNPRQLQLRWLYVGSTQSAQLLIVLHELAHMLQAQDPDPSPSKVPGFRHDGRDPTGGVSTQNTYLVLAKCQAMIERVFQ